MVGKVRLQGFGVESIDDNYFIVNFMESSNKVEVKEVFKRQYIDGDNLVEDSISNMIVSIESSKLSKSIQAELSKVFNKQLKESNLKKGSWGKDCKTYLNKFLGKELLVFLWAIEDTDNSKEIKTIFNNWKSLKPTERWWLYTMINNENDSNIEAGSITNWKKAIKIALLPSK